MGGMRIDYSGHNCCTFGFRGAKKQVDICYIIFDRPIHNITISYAFVKTQNRIEGKKNVFVKFQTKGSRILKIFTQKMKLIKKMSIHHNHRLSICQR